MVRLIRRVKLGALWNKRDRHATLGDVRVVLVTAIRSLKCRIGIVDRDDRTRTRQARQGVLAGDKGALAEAVLHGRVDDGEARDVCGRGLPDADGDVVLGRVQGVKLAGRLHLPGEGPRQRPGVREECGRVVGLVLGGAVLVEDAAWVGGGVEGREHSGVGPGTGVVALHQPIFDGGREVEGRVRHIGDELERL